MRPDAALPVRNETDIVLVRQAGRRLAAELGFDSSGQTLIATAISEIARNIVQYAGEGDMALTIVTAADGRRGLHVVASDSGPGIPDVALAMQDGYSTGGGLGLGLPGARRLMDEFRLSSEVGVGTTVAMTKWAGP